VKLNYLRSSSV